MASIGTVLKTRPMWNESFNGSQNLIGASSSLINSYVYNSGDLPFPSSTFAPKQVLRTSTMLPDNLIPTDETFTKQFLISNSKGPFNSGYLFLQSSLFIPFFSSLNFNQGFNYLPIYITTNPTQCKRLFAPSTNPMGNWKGESEVDPNTMLEPGTTNPSSSPTFMDISNSYNKTRAEMGNFILGCFAFEPENPDNKIPSPFLFPIIRGSTHREFQNFIYVESIYLSYDAPNSYVNVVFKSPNPFNPDPPINIGEFVNPGASDSLGAPVFYPID